MPALRQSGKGPQARGGARSGEEGFILIAVLFLVALVLIALAVAAPRMAKSIQRDKEIEAVHRGEQYKRAIQLYYRKFGRYPSSIDQLVDTNNIRFLRKKYTDPITGKSDWRLIHPGQAKVPPMGFFGQPLAGIPGAANLDAHTNGATGASTGTSAFGSSMGTSAFGSSMGSSAFGSSTSGGTAVETPAAGSSSASPSGPTSDSNNPSTPGTSSALGSSSMGASDKVGAGKISSTDAGSNSPMSVGQIIGVGIPSPKPSLLDYKKQTQYSKWEFVYFPIEDQMKAMGAMGAGGGNVNGTGGPTSTSPFGNSNSPFGNGSGNGNSPFGNSGSTFGNSGSTFGNSGSTFGSGTTTQSGPATSNPQQ